MKRIYLLILVFLSVPAWIFAQDLDIYGYLEPQYTGIYVNENSYQMQSNRLRVDMRSIMNGNVEFGANFISLLYFGKKTWDILDFLPEDIISSIPSEMLGFYKMTYHDRYFLDNAYIRISGNRYAFTIGKQQISPGTGYFSNPTDVFNIKDALDPTYEQPGHNAIRMDLMLDSRVKLVLLYGPIEEKWRESGKLLRFKAGFRHFDFSLLACEIYQDRTDFYTLITGHEFRRMVGFDFVGQLLGMGVWGEGTYNYMDISDDYYEFIVGTDYTFETGLYMLLEYHRNDIAEDDYENYDLNDWLRYLTGESKTIAKDQFYGFIQYPLTELIRIGSSAVYSISDGSAAFVPTLEYNAFNNMELTLMFNIFSGKEGKAFSSKLGNIGLIRCRVYF